MTKAEFDKAVAEALAGSHYGVLSRSDVATDLWPLFKAQQDAASLPTGDTGLRGALERIGVIKRWPWGYTRGSNEVVEWMCHSCHEKFTDRGDENGQCPVTNKHCPSAIARAALSSTPPAVAESATTAPATPSRSKGEGLRPAAHVAHDVMDSWRLCDWSAAMEHGPACAAVAAAIEADRAIRPAGAPLRATGLDAVAAALAVKCPKCRWGKPGKPCSRWLNPDKGDDMFCASRITRALASPPPPPVDAGGGK